MMKSTCEGFQWETEAAVLVAGACRHERSLAYQLLMAVLDRRIPLMLTEGITAENEEVLMRPSVRKLTGLTAKQSSDLILELISLSHQTQLHFSWRPNLLDEADNKFIEAAVAATAIIITYNLRDFARFPLPSFLKPRGSDSKELRPL